MELRFVNRIPARKRSTTKYPLFTELLLIHHKEKGSGQVASFLGSTLNGRGRNGALIVHNW